MPEPIARLALLGLGRPLVDVIERQDSGGVKWTQVVVPESWFSIELLERMRLAPAADRSFIFSPLPHDEDEAGGGATS